MVKYSTEENGIGQTFCGKARIRQVCLQEWIGLENISCGNRWDRSNFLQEHVGLVKHSVGRPGLFNGLCRSRWDWGKFPVGIGGIGQISFRNR